MSVKRTSLVAASGDDPLSLLGGGPAAAASAVAPPALAPRPLPIIAANPKLDADDIVVDSERARNIAQRVERKEHAPLYVGTPAAAATAARPLSASSPARPAAGGAASSASSPASSSSKGSMQRRSIISFKASSLPNRARDWNPPPQLTTESADDWDSHGKLPGEKAVMQIPDVVCWNSHDDITSVQHCLWGTLFMTSYQLFLEPSQRRDRLGPSVLAIPLSTIDRIEIEKSRGGSSSTAVGNILGAPHHLLNYLEVYSKDGRTLRFGFMKFDEAKRAYDCIGSYVFPQKDEFLFAFYYKIKTPIPEHLDGWNLYDPIEEFKRQGINTIGLQTPASLQSEELRLSWANEAYTMCTSYPRVFVVPSEKYVSDLDLLHVAHFRSRGRIPVCTWKHPSTRQTIWRCAQPKVGMNNTRCQEDERLLSAITNYAAHGEMFAIFDARPRFNARANILAGKGFENPELYKNAVKKIHFMDIQNIHVMRDSYNKLVKACQKEQHDFNFIQNVNASGWFNHLACCLKATAEMVKVLDQDKISLLIHCFPADHQLLTSEGFMDLDEVRARAPYLDPKERRKRLPEEKELLFAAYDPDTKAMTYLPASRLVVKQANELIEFGAKDHTEPHSNGVSLLVTPEHDMFAQVGKSTSNGASWEWESSSSKRPLPPQKRQAHTLVTSDPAAGVKMVAAVANGLDVTDNLKTLPFVLGLGLQGDKQIAAFLKLYGFWLGASSMVYAGIGGPQDAVVFSQRNAADIAWLTAQLQAVGLQHGMDWTMNFCPATHLNQFLVLKPSWLALFDSEYGRSAERPSTRWLCGWVWQLGKSSLRHLLSGMRRADGAEETNGSAIYASSVRLRDELVRVCLHAGFSAIFQLHRAAGSNRGSDIWRVSYCENTEHSEPVLQCSTDVKRTKVADQRVWCVTVPPHGLIVARRVQRNDAGVITQASRPLVVGNCSDGWDRTAQLSSLCCLCLDPYYRTTKGFMVLVEKEWVSFGHQFARRTGHRDKNYSDDQRSCIFLQWCDTVYQLLVQFPRHFEFNSHFLVTLMHHLYSCRFGTFLHNSDVVRRKMKMKEKTVSVWTYFMCSPAAVAGEFTNQLYSPNGDGSVREAVARPAAAAADDDAGKNSYGRGGGDGSRIATGTVLYPSYSLKKITLWSDYFLRWQNEQLEQVPISNATAGSVAPGGCATTRMQGNEAVLQKEIRKERKEKEALSHTASHQAARLRELEAELHQLKAKYGLADGSGSSGDAASAGGEATEAKSGDPTSANGALSSSSSSGPLAPVDEADSDEAPPSADERAAIEALKKRLQKDVDANVDVRPEEPEDPSTL